MFQFSGFADFRLSGLSHSDIYEFYRLFAPPRSFSQLVTSFVADEILGIHRVPFSFSFFYSFSDSF